uniref:Uncharacterized protein n=1 Tax=Burkholderia sp. M701 TaxID=326454 RepID=V5YNS8_9BURK|nr:hypothetical protein [Burkholderia sp. M701]BAO18919.1 hypothetical protein [Burkholderia sp. M701]
MNMEQAGERNIPFLVDLIGVAAHVDLDNSQRDAIASLLRALPDGAELKDFVEAANSEVDRYPFQQTLLVPIVLGLRALSAQPAWTIGLFQTAGASGFFDLAHEEIDMKAYVDAKFSAGVGVLTVSQNTPDEVIVFAVRRAMVIGKPFAVIPAST